MEKAMRSVLKFDGVKDHVNLGKRPEFKIARDLTLAAWVFVEKQTNYAGIISKAYDTDHRESGYGLLLNGKTGLMLAIKPPTSGNTIAYLQSDGLTLPLNEWHHVAATYDGKQALFYLDGEKVSSAAFVTDRILDDIDNNLTLGAYKDDDELYPFQGKIAEVAIWSAAQTPEQIRNHMRGGTTGSEDHLVGRWSIGEGNGGVIGDKSQHTNQGTINGAKWEQIAVPLESPSQKVEREKAEKEAADRKKAEQEAADRKKVEQEAADRKKAEQEAADQAEQEAADRKKAEQEAADRKKAEQEAARNAEESKKHGDYESQLAEHGKQIAKLQEALNDKGAKIADLENKLAKCGDCCAKLEAAQAAIDKLGTQLAALTKKFDSANPPAPAPAPAPTPTPPPAPVTPDDLTLIEGIGPKISELLGHAGILTFAQLAAMEATRIKELLTAGGSRFAVADPTTWPAQAKLAAEQRWDEFKAMLGNLRAGRKAH